jgi:hypothetical protein
MRHQKHVKAGHGNPTQPASQFWYELPSISGKSFHMASFMCSDVLTKKLGQ